MSDRKTVDPYEEVLQSEVLKNLGHAVHSFRNIQSTIQLEVANTMDTELLVTALNAIYQKSITEVFDALICCRDMRLSRTAIDGLRRSIDVTRGFRKA